MSARALTFTVAAALTLSAIAARGANPTGPLDLPPSNITPAPVDMMAPTQRGPERPSEPTGNPLWAIPMSSLTATRERPIFLPSRRAPAPAVAAAPQIAAPPPPPPPAAPEQLQLALVGAVAGDNDGFAVFIDQATNNVIRLRTGQDHLGWVLRSVKGREATLERGGEVTTVAMPAPGGPPAAPRIPAGTVPGYVPAPNALPGASTPAKLPRPGVRLDGDGHPVAPDVE